MPIFKMANIKIIPWFEIVQLYSQEKKILTSARFYQCTSVFIVCLLRRNLNTHPENTYLDKEILFERFLKDHVWKNVHSQVGRIRA